MRCWAASRCRGDTSALAAAGDRGSGLPLSTGLRYAGATEAPPACGGFAFGAKKGGSWAAHSTGGEPPGDGNTAATLDGASLFRDGGAPGELYPSGRRVIPDSL